VSNYLLKLKSCSFKVAHNVSALADGAIKFKELAGSASALSASAMLSAVLPLTEDAP
jgi:hypothetical protein